MADVEPISHGGLSPAGLQAMAHLNAGSPQQALQCIGAAWAAGERSAALCNLAGVCAVQLGFAEEAERLWAEAVSLDPQSAQPYFNLGLLYARSGRDVEAETAYRRAIALDPTHALACANLGLVLERVGRAEEAGAAYRQALARDPAHAAAHTNLGVWLAQRDCVDEAETHYRLALAVRRDADTLSNLGVLLAKRQASDAAEQCYREALALEPEHPAAWLNLGVLLAARKDWDAAAACQQAVLARAPQHARARANLGLVCEGRGDLAAAVAHLRMALAIEPELAEVHSNLGNLLARLGQAEAAEAALRAAVALRPQSAVGQCNLGVLLVHEGREAEGEAALRCALACTPDYALARLNLGFLLLAQGRFEEGWALHEARYDPSLPDNGMPLPALPMPCWRGEALAGKSILVLPEQGFGDEIQFCRYLPLLKAAGAARVAFCCKPALLPVLRSLPGVEWVSTPADLADLSQFDYWSFLLSLPFGCQTRLETIPAPIPYLRAPARKWEGEPLRLSATALKVGLVWRGNPDHNNDADRSLPGLEILRPWWSVPGVQFVSLQKGADAAIEATAAAGQPLLALGAACQDFGDTAALVAQLDVVIGVDTAVVHLAAALGVPCWVLLPAYRTDWRWLRGREDSPWYPGVMRLFRQRCRGDWAPVIEAVRQALVTRASV